MRLNITVGGFSHAGYTTIDPVFNTADRLNIQLNQLDNVVEDSECTDIILDNILHYIKLEQIETLLSHVIRKLRHNGELVINFNDINLLSQKIFRCSIEPEQYNEVLFNGKQSVFTLQYLEEILKNNNLEITSKEFVSFKGTLKARRP